MKKIIAIATALTTVVMIAGPSAAGAVTADELQAQINALLAQLSALQGQLATMGGTTTPAAVSGCTITSFTRNLSQGATGDDVKCLQIILNSSADTQVAASGVGSSGSETTYFGSLTKAAVVKFQNKYASEVLNSIGLTAGTGFVGTQTRAKLNTMITSSITPTTPTTPTTPVVPTGAGLSVYLASDNPVSGTLVSGSTASVSQSVAPLAKYVFVNGDNAEVKVTQLKLKRIGVSADTTLANTYLFEGAKRLTDAASVSSSVISFNDSTGIFVVPAGGSKTITVKSDIAASTSGQTVGVSIGASTDITTNASAVKGTFPANSNLMNIASGTLATASFAANYTPTTNDSVTPQNDYTVWYDTVIIGTRAVNLNRISLREIGTINYSDLQNLKLYVDGVQKGSTVATLDSNGYVTFDLSSSPVRLETGNRVIKVNADIIGGATRTYRFSIRNAADANFTDTQYNADVYPTTNNSTTTFTVAHVQAGLQTISTGTITITKRTDSPAGNVVNGASGVTLAKYDIKAAGENVKIESLDVQVKWTGSSTTAATLRNGKLMANGVQIGSTTNIDIDDTTFDTTATTFNLGSSLIVVPGSPVVLEVVADIYGVTSASAAVALTSADTLTAEIYTGATNAIGLVSSTSINAPGAVQDGNAVTVAEGTLALAKYTAYTNQNMVAPLTNAKLAHFTLTAGTAEAVNINTITVEFDDAYNSGTFSAASDLTNLYVTYGNQTTAIKPTVSSANAGNAWSVNYQLASGQTIELIVYADIGPNVDAGAWANAEMTVSGITANSAATADSATDVEGQIIVFATGSLTTAVSGDTPKAQMVSGSNAADVAAGTFKQITAGKYKFTASNDSYTITELRAKVTSAAVSAAIIGAVLKDGSTVLGTMPFNATDSSSVSTYGAVTNYGANTVAHFTGLNIVVPMNTTKTLTVDLVLSQPSATASTSGVDAIVRMDWIKVYNSKGTAYTTSTGTDRAGNDIYVFQSIPTFSEVNLANSVLTNGSSNKIYSFKVAADSKGPVILKQLKFNLTWNDAQGSSILKLNNFKFYRGSTNLTTTEVKIQDDQGVDIEGAASVNESDTTAAVIVTFLDGYEEQIPAGSEYTYSLYAQPQGFVYSSTSGYDSFAISLPAETATHDATLIYEKTAGTGIVQLATAADGTGASNANIIWSDNSAVIHSDTSGSSSKDWTDGLAGLMLNLPLDPESWQCQ